MNERTHTTDQREWRSALREQGRSLAWLADRTGISRASVYAYSCGARRPSAAWLAKVAALLGLERAA